jgi:hypothetical protein
MSTYDDASLIYYPSGYKEDKIYSLKPTDGSGDLTFTRASSATRVNSDGLIESPRTNLVLYSEEFDNAYWTKTNVTITANATTAPDGNLTADKLVENSVNGNHFIYRSQATFTASASYFQSWYVKAGERYKVRIQDASDGTFFAAYNLNTGSLIDEGTNTIGNTTITPLLNGWYRLTLLLNQATSAKYAGIILLPDSYTAGDSITYQGNGTSGVYIWGAQIEAGSTATDYIPTTNSARTTFAGITQDGTSASNIPRIDYTGGGCGKLLLEPQRTNSFTFSENITNFSTLGRLNCGYTLGSSFGSFTTSCLITSTSFTGSLIRGVLGFNSVNTENNYFTIRFQKKSGWYLSVLSGNGCAAGDLRINLASGGGYISSSGTMLTDYEIVEFSDYFQIGFKTTQIATTSAGLVNLNLYDNASFINYNDSGGTTFNVSGIQWENQQTYGTSYIPTTTTAVTRLADAASKTGISSLIGQTEGVLFVEMAALVNSGTIRVLSISDGTSQNRITIEYYSVPNYIVSRVTSGNVQGAFMVGSTFDQSLNSKFAVRYALNDCAIFINGIKVDFDLSVIMPISLNSLRFDDGSGGSKFEGKIRQLQLFKTALTDEELITLTTL